MTQKKAHAVSWLLYAYYFLPLLLVVFQLVSTINSSNQIREEELLEAVTSVFWFDHRSVFYGAYTNVGWYMVLSGIYHTFGFNLFTAKYVRVGLHLISLICLALVLKKYLGVKKAFLPLLTIGLSPTWLYFNTLGAEFGIDMQYFPITFYLIDNLNFKFAFWNITQSILSWAIVMVSWMSYPTIIYYLPGLALLYIIKLKKANMNFASNIKHIFFSFLGFITPFLAMVLYIQNQQFLLNDPYVKSGIFRGAGNLSLQANPAKALSALAIDFFNIGRSYYFELHKVEFSQIFPLIPLVIVLGLSLWLIKYTKIRLLIITTISLSLINILVSSFTIDPSGMPGIRRYTGLLSAFYLLFILVWYYLTSQKNHLFWNRLMMGGMCLLVIHHLLVFPANLSSLKEPSQFQEDKWFSISKGPENTLSQLVEAIQKQDVSLACLDKTNQPTSCRFSEIYAAVAGTCLWNRLKCHQLSIFNPYTQQLIPLSVDKWNSYFFVH